MSCADVHAVVPAPGGPVESPGRAAAAVPLRARFSAPLETKLHGPEARGEWVERPQLVSYLAGLATRLVLVDAPAGFGKTTVVAQWRSSAAETRPFVGAHPIPQGLCSGNSPGPGRILILAAARGLGGDDAPGPFVGAVAGPVHEDLVAGIDEPVQE